MIRDNSLIARIYEQLKKLIFFTIIDTKKGSFVYKDLRVEHEITTFTFPTHWFVIGNVTSS